MQTMYQNMCDGCASDKVIGPQDKTCTLCDEIVARNKLLHGFNDLRQVSDQNLNLRHSCSSARCFGLANGLYN